MTEFEKIKQMDIDEISAIKPPAVVYIDDRAITFDGKASTLLDKINNFVPWNKKEKGEINARWVKNEHINFYQCSLCGVAAPHDAEDEEWLTPFCPVMRLMSLRGLRTRGSG